MRLVKEGRTPEDISATFGLPALMIKRVLALGNLLPRIRDLYRAEKIDEATVRHLTLASKSQQKAWLALYDDPDNWTPTGHQLKAWLFGGQSIKASAALFDVDDSGVATIADLFGEDRYFADADAFWTAQNAAIEAKRADYLGSTKTGTISLAQSHCRASRISRAVSRQRSIRCDPIPIRTRATTNAAINALGTRGCRPTPA